MKTKELELEYEFDMSGIVKSLSFILALWFFIIVIIHVITNYFNWGFGIPLVLLLTLYVVIDSHNDQVKERNNVRLKEVLDSNNYIELTHKTAIKALGQK